MTQLAFSEPREPSLHRVADGAIWLKRWLSIDAQGALVEPCHQLMDQGGYVPTVRGGGRMHVRMLCLGRHWNPLTYRYEATRSDYDGAPVAPIPPDWIAIARDVARHAGFEVTPDVCLINSYEGDGRMGVHQDKDETPSSI